MSLFYRVCRVLCIALAKLFFRLRTGGLENVPLAGGVVLASNHQCYLDPPLATCLIRRQCNYLARSNLFNFGPFRWLIMKLGAVPLSRGASDATGLRRAVELLQAGRLLMLFPEGTRTRDGRLGPVLPGVAAIAARAGVPVVPTYIHGAFDAWPRSRKLPRPGRVGIFYGRPIPPEAGPAGGGGERKARVAALTDEIRSALEALERQAFEVMPLPRRAIPPAPAAQDEARPTGRGAPEEGSGSSSGASGAGSAGAAPQVEGSGNGQT